MLWNEYACACCRVSADHGVVVMQVFNESAGHLAGVRRNDLIVALNGEDVRHGEHDDVVNKIKMLKAAGAFKMDVERRIPVGRRQVCFPPGLCAGGSRLIRSKLHRFWVCFFFVCAGCHSAVSQPRLWHEAGHGRRRHR